MSDLRLAINRAFAISLCGGLLMCAAASLAPVAAQNLVSNPDFDTDLTGWDAAAATIFDGSQGGTSGPGSALWRLTVNVETATQDLLIVSQCVDGVVAGTTYQFGGEMNLDAAPVGSSAIVVVSWQDNPGCSGLLSLDAAPPVTEPGSFISVTGSAVAPAGAESAEIDVISGVAPGGPGPITVGDLSIVEGDYLVNVDDVFFQPVETAPTMGPAWMLALVALLLGLGAFVVGRMRVRTLDS